MSLPRPRPAVGAAIVTAWGLSLIAAFLLNRTYDLPHLPGWLRTDAVALASGPLLVPWPLLESLAGAGIAALMVMAWWGVGDVVVHAIDRTEENESAGALGFATRCLYGAAVLSTLCFVLGAARLYRSSLAHVVLVAGLALAGWAWSHRSPAVTSSAERRQRGGRAQARGVLALMGGVQGLSLCGALAPPTANDTLLYHLSLPKAWVLAGGMVELPDNVARFYPLGAEMQCVWGLLLGRPWSPRVGEAAAMAALFAFAPLLVLVTYGWSRERGLDARWASLGALTVATIPTVYWVAASGYIDLALAAYTVLAVRAVGRWWQTDETRWLLHTAWAVGAALAVKLSAAILVLPLLLILLVRSFGLRPAPPGVGGVTPWCRLRAGGVSLLVALVLAGPWYLRNWLQTGSPFFPFFPGLWPGSAQGWDLERARLYETLFLLYGRPGTILDDVLAPVLLSLTAQPELPTHYDGVLGIALLFALPFLAWAWWTRRLDVELRLAVAVSLVLYVVWIFSSQQFRYLLPVVPLLVTAMMASAAQASQRGGPLLERVTTWTFLASAAVNALLIVTWFAEVAPVRVVLGGESREAYLARRLDYYPYYQVINRDLPLGARVWLIDMRRDSYHIERPYVGDFIFEDHTLKTWVRQAASADEVRDRALAAGITHVLVRHDLLLDYARSAIVDEGLPRETNLANLQRTRAFFAEGTRVIRVDGKYGLIELPHERGKLGGTAGTS